MNRAVRDCLVEGYEPIEHGLDLPDPDDHHVLAAAIRAKAQVLVTWNVRDFPDAALQPWDIDVKSPDAFVLDQLDLGREAVYGAVQRIADSWTSPPGTVADVLDRIENDGLVRSAAALRG